MTMLNITVANSGKTIAASEANILESALSSGLIVPHGCRSGSCGSCKARLLEGRVELGDYDPGVLTEAERADGLIVICRSRAMTNVTVELLDEIDTGDFHPIRKLKAVVVDLEKATHDITIVRLEPVNETLPFKAGQYSELTFGRGYTRPYSMANRPEESVLEFHIRHLPGGATSGYVAKKLRIGDTVMVKGPYGCAHLRLGHAGPIIGIAGGAGLAPIKSIVETALSTGFRHNVSLYFGVRDEGDIYYIEQLRGLADMSRNLKIDVALSEPSSSTMFRTGWIHEAVSADHESLAGSKVYVAGPPPMVQAATAMAKEKGVPDRDIHADAFLAGPPPNPLGRGILQSIRNAFRR